LLKICQQKISYIRELRITVRRVLELLATYPDRNTLFTEYPFLEPEDLQQALRYTAAAVDDYLNLYCTISLL
jgi:uncharacterized protein (DUF433 family)